MCVSTLEVCAHMTHWWIWSEMDHKVLHKIVESISDKVHNAIKPFYHHTAMVFQSVGWMEID